MTLPAKVDRVEALGASLLVYFGVDAPAAKSAGVAAALGAHSRRSASRALGQRVLRDLRAAHRRPRRRPRRGGRRRRPSALLRSRDGRRAHALNTRSFWAPGRVNLIGEFTDLAGGLVLPVALDLGIRVDCVASERTLLTSDAFEGTSEDSNWGRYAAAVEAELSDLGRAPVGIEGTVHSTLPIGAGLSSSAALEVAIAVALCAVAEFELEPLDLARAAQRAEHRAVGVPSGIMDQAASCSAARAMRSSSTRARWRSSTSRCRRSSRSSSSTRESPAGWSRRRTASAVASSTGPPRARSSRHDGESAGE